MDAVTFTYEGWPDLGDGGGGCIEGWGGNARKIFYTDVGSLPIEKAVKYLRDITAKFKEQEVGG